MPNYTYKAHDNRNRLISGTMDGASVDAVVENLTGRNLLPITVEEMNFDGSARNEKFSEKIAANFKRFQGRVPYKTVVFFTRQFATMIAGGVPLARALEQLAGAEKTAFRTIINQIKDDISIGYSFSDAVARHPGVFNSMFISIIRSGEMAGALDAVLDQLATYMENVEAMRAKVKAAMRYPMFIGGFVIILIIGILWKLVPIFEGANWIEREITEMLGINFIGGAARPDPHAGGGFPFFPRQSAPPWRHHRPRSHRLPGRHGERSV